MLHKLALLYECGISIDNVIFVDCEDATKLLMQANELSNAPSIYCLGKCYEYGKMGCLQDPAPSMKSIGLVAPSVDTGGGKS